MRGSTDGARDPEDAVLVDAATHPQDSPCDPLDDLPGLLRRVRRCAGMNQRELAAALGVSHSLIGQWEAGKGSQMGVCTLKQLLRLADLHLEVRDAEGHEVTAMGSEDTVRDRAGRRYPAHLEVVPVGEPRLVRPSPQRPPRVRSLGRPRRTMHDDLRLLLGHSLGMAPLSRERRHADHPTRSEVWRACEAAAEARERASLAEALERREKLSQPTVEECTCPVDCEESIRCVAACSCQCVSEHWR